MHDVRVQRYIFAAAASFAALLSGAGELDVAREALRDGLWEVARTHASKLEGDEAAVLVLESYAREGRWEDALKTIDSGGPHSGGAFSYYKALALAESGRKSEASAVLASAKFDDKEFAVPVARLRARLAADAGNGREALRIVRENALADGDVESRMDAASVMAASGDAAGAERIWRAVASDTNAAERAFVTAAANLGDAKLLRSAYGRAKSVDMRRLAGLRLGRALLADSKTFEEGASMIRAIAKDAPDAKGAKESFSALADALLAAGRFQDAADAYRLLLETWPAAAFDPQVQEGRAWSLRKLGKSEEALEAFARAEETSGNDGARAAAALAQGDVLAEMGRGEEAMSKYRLILSKYPKTASAEKLTVVVRQRELESRGRELYKNYSFAEAQKVFAQLAEEDPARRPRMRFFEVLCLYGQGRDRDALELARGLAESSPDAEIRAETTLWLAKYAYNRRRWGESCRLFSSFADMMPKSREAPSALTWSARAAFAENDFKLAIQTATKLAERYPDSPERVRGYIVQGEALIELARFDEAVLVLERALMAESAPPEERLRAQVIKADALFAMGADNPARYREALDSYRAVLLGEALSPSLKITVSFKTGRALEKLKRMDEAVDQYYAEVVLAYREGRLAGVRFDDEARAAFSRAAFRLADEYESRGKDFQAMHILELVVASDVPAADEAEKRIDRIQTKGKFL